MLCGLSPDPIDGATLCARVERILERVYYRGYKFAIRNRNGTVLIQHRQVVECITKNEPEEQGGRWFFISPHMTDEEILRTAFLAVKLFEEHEINETFLVDGERFLNPHPEGPRK